MLRLVECRRRCQTSVNRVHCRRAASALNKFMNNAVFNEVRNRCQGDSATQIVATHHGRLYSTASWAWRQHQRPERCEWDTASPCRQVSQRSRPWNALTGDGGGDLDAQTASGLTVRNAVVTAKNSTKRAVIALAQFEAARVMNSFVQKMKASYVGWQKLKCPANYDAVQ